MKYFYIVMRSHGMYEIEFSEEVYKKAISLWQSGGIILVKPKGYEVPIGLNSSDVSAILTESSYDNYLLSGNYKSYIKRGSWYDNKNVLIHHEPWKQKKIDDKLKLPEAKPDEEGMRKIAELMKQSGFGKGILGSIKS